jgi:hypothetical protein
MWLRQRKPFFPRLQAALRTNAIGRPLALEHGPSAAQLRGLTTS